MSVDKDVKSWFGGKIKSTDIAIIAGGVILAGGAVYVINKFVNETLPREAPLMVWRSLEEARAKTFSGSVIIDTVAAGALLIVVNKYIAPAAGVSAVYLIAYATQVARLVMDQFATVAMSFGTRVPWRDVLSYIISQEFVRNSFRGETGNEIRRITDHIQHDPDYVPMIPRYPVQERSLTERSNSEVALNDYIAEINNASRQLWTENKSKPTDMGRYFIYMFLWLAHKLGGDCYYLGSHAGETINAIFKEGGDSSPNITQVRLRTDEFSMYMDIKVKDLDWITLIDFANDDYSQALTALIDAFAQRLLPRDSTRSWSNMSDPEPKKNANVVVKEVVQSIRRY